MDLMVTPWIFESEWRKVSNYVTSLEAVQLKKAEEILSAWQCRVYRLPTGELLHLESG
jgi:energy-coupling factor transporter transmembrane protein EcfT